MAALATGSTRSRMTHSRQGRTAYSITSSGWRDRLVLSPCWGGYHRQRPPTSPSETVGGVSKWLAWIEAGATQLRKRPRRRRVHKSIGTGVAPRWASLVREADPRRALRGRRALAGEIEI